MNTSKNHPTINFARTFPVAPRKLEEPFVPAAFHDEDNEGLLPVSALTRPVLVELKMWTVAQTGDTYQTLWDGEGIGSIKDIKDEDQPGDTLFLDIPVENLTEGAHLLAYRTINHENGTTVDSPSVPVEVDLTPPVARN